MAISQVSTFDANGDISSFAIRWDDWSDSFEIYAAASGVESDSHKRSLLLHCAGKQVQDLFKTLGDTGTTYDAAKAKLDTHFKPKMNLSYQRHLFKKECQQSDEAVSQFVVRLRKIAQTYVFPPDELENCIRDQVIDKCSCTRYSEKNYWLKQI